MAIAVIIAASKPSDHGVFVKLTRILALVPIVGLACCAPAPQPAPPAPPAQTRIAVPPPVVAAPRYDNWLDAPQTLGDWKYSDNGTLSFATFGQPGEGARFGFECRKGSGAVRLVRGASLAAATPMRIRTETADRMMTAAPEPGGLPTLATTLPANDRFLDAIALSRGRFAVETQGLETLYLPAWPEVTRVIEDCR